MLYESKFNRLEENDVNERNRLLQGIEGTLIRILVFAEASHGERKELYPPEIHSLYFPYSLFQSAVI